MATLTTEFSGLCSYLYHPSSRYVEVLLTEHHHHPHDPILLVERDSVSNEKELGNFTVIGPLAYVDLSGYDLRITSSGSGGVTLFHPTDAAQGCPSDADKEYIAWMVDLNHVTKGKAREELKDPSSMPMHVVSRVFLEDGELRCGAHSSEDGVVHKYGIGSDPPRAVGAVTRHILGGAGSASVALTFTGHGPRKQDFNFGLDLPASVIVANAPRPLSSGTAGDHFDAYYDLLIPSSPRPVLVDAGPCPTQADALATYPPKKPCPQSLMHGT